MDAPQPLLEAPSNAPNLPTDASERQRYLDKLGQYLTNVYREYESAHTDIFDRYDKCYQTYSFHVERKANRLLANVRMPEVWTAVRILAAGLMDSVLATDPLYNVLPVCQTLPTVPNDFTRAESTAQILEELLNWFHYLGGGPSRVVSAAMYGLVYGPLWGQVGWRIERNGHGDPLREFPEVVPLSPYRMMMDPKALEPEPAMFTFRTLRLCRHEARQHVRDGLWFPEETAGLQYATSTAQTQADSHDQLQAEDRLMYDAMTSNGTTSVVETQLRLDPGNTGDYEMHLCWFSPVTQKVVGLKRQLFDNGKRTIVLGRLYPDTQDHPFTIPITEALHSVYHTINSIINMAIDNAAQSLNGRTLVNRNAFINSSQLRRSVPGGVIEGDDITDSGIRPFQAQNYSQQAMMLVQMFDGKKQEYSGVTDQAMAMRAASTATGTGIVDKHAQVNLNVLAFNLADSFLNPIANQQVKMIQQFLSMKTAVKIRSEGMADRMIQVNRDDLGGDFIARCRDIRVSTKRMQLSQALQSQFAVSIQGQLPAPYIRWQKLMMQLMDVPNVESMWNMQNLMLPPGAVQQPTVSGQNRPTDKKPTSAEQADRPRLQQGPGGDMPADIASLPGMGEG